MKKKTGNILKYLVAILVVLVVAFFIIIFPKSVGVDLSKIKLDLRAQVTSNASNTITSDTEEEKAISNAKRSKYVNTLRAEQYLKTATGDYYKGSYEDALRRLNRAEIYDPENFGIFKLTGQIFFEKSKYKKAFDHWERASQLPNDDSTISRDVNVLKRLIRYSRTQIDKLQREVNRHPNDKIAQARLKELEDKMQ